MTKREKEIRNRLKVLKQQLSLITTYQSHFNKKLGKTGANNLIDIILDEIIFLTDELDNLKNN